MAGDVWRWCQVHQKWLQDVNVCVGQRGLEHDRPDSASHNFFSHSSRSLDSSRADCLERCGRKPSGSAAASSRWQDDSRTLDPVPPTPRFTTAKSYKGRPLSQGSASALRSLPRSSLGLGMQDAAKPTESSPDVENVWPRTSASRYKRPVRWLFAEAPIQSNFCENAAEGENWVTVFSSLPPRDPGDGPARFGTSELLRVIREFEKCGTIVERVVGPDGANWVQIKYQSSQEAGQALMKSGLRLKGGITVVVRSLDKRQRKQLLLETISKSGNHSMGGSSKYIMPTSYGLIDIDSVKEEEGPPKSSVSKFVDLVFDCERDYQISPAGYIIPIRFEPGLYKELFKSQVHRCDAFVTPHCDPAATQPLYFEYPRKSVDPCDYAQNKLDELRDIAGEEVANLPPSGRTHFRPTGKTVCGGKTWRGSDFSSDSQQHFCGCAPQGPECPECPESSECRECDD